MRHVSYKSKISPKITKPTMDLLLISVLAILVLGLSLYFDLCESLIDFVYTQKAYRLDEILVVVLVLVFAFAFFSLRRWLELKAEIEKNNRLFEQVSQAKERLQLLSSQLLDAQESERRRIAHELHDQIGQALTAVKINLQATRKNTPHSNLTRLEDSIFITEEALQQVRNMALDLRPSILDDLGLVVALEWYMERTALRSGLIVKLELDLDEKLTPEIEVACFRITQEAVNNIARHAQATTIKLRLSATQEQLELSITDDGIGFDPDEAFRRATRGNSLGLLGMQERSQLAQGQFQIKTAHGAGTTILVQFPLTSVAIAVK